MVTVVETLPDIDMRAVLSERWLGLVWVDRGEGRAFEADLGGGQAVVVVGGAVSDTAGPTYTAAYRDAQGQLFSCKRSSYQRDPVRAVQSALRMAEAYCGAELPLQSKFWWGRW